MDPCDGITNADVSDVADNCRSFPAIQNRIDLTGAFTLTQIEFQKTRRLSSGNPDVLEEKADSWSVGIVFTPTSWEAFSFAADCIVHVVEETAAGADQVAGWPNTDWRDWMPSFLTLGYLFLLSGVAGYGLNWLLSLAMETQGLPLWLVPPLLFPVLLFSLFWRRFGDRRWGTQLFPGLMFGLVYATFQLVSDNLSLFPWHWQAAPSYLFRVLLTSTIAAAIIVPLLVLFLDYVGAKLEFTTYRRKRPVSR